jgi:hypothetical protein
MRSKITVVGDSGGGEGLASTLSAGDRADVVTVSGAWADLAGSEVVVLGGGADVPAAAGEVARRAPAAVVVLATADGERDCAAALEASLLPRPRVFAVAPGDVQAAVEAVVHGREAALEAAVLCRGELGIDDRVATVPVRVGPGGVRSIG